MVIRGLALAILSAALLAGWTHGYSPVLFDVSGSALTDVSGATLTVR